MKKIVLGVEIDDVSLDESVKIVTGWMDSKQKRYIVTPNPEIIVAAQRDSEFKKILNNADLSIPDGRGLKIGTDIVCCTPGVDLMEALCKEASEKGYTTGFLGGKNGVAVQAVKCLQKKYKNLKVSFVSEEPTNISKADILFVAFGAPKQEKWIAANLNNIPVKVAMGVGGAFDYISGRVPRAPKWIRSLGLEWLFRLIIQPWRIKRQLSLIRYLYLVLH
jgi:N-acetylglucosaminyldiphosphoundecaprenol N-acetyl-beta-D-mannosaminyltransferase